MSRKAVAVLGCLAVALSAIGCGYQWVRYSSALGEQQRVAIRAFGNDSFEPGADSIVSDAIYREFLRRGATQLVEDPGAADLVIAGTVDEVTVRRRSFSSVEFALEYEIRMRLDLVVTRGDGTEVQIDRRALTANDLYFSSSDVETGRTYRREAVQRMAGVLAGRIHDALYERISP